jgi:predicted nucleic acid-binding protein
LSTDLAELLTKLQTPPHGLRRRPDTSLQFCDAVPVPEPVLFDTTVYIDVLHGQLSDHLKREIARLEPWHSSVVESEMTYLCGRLDPNHPGTSHVIQEIASIVDHWPPARVLNPDREIWREAAILSGILARLQHVKDEDRGRTMNDALIFLSAAQHGGAVLTRNVRDFDLLMQLVPEGKAVFYRIP